MSKKFVFCHHTSGYEHLECDRQAAAIQIHLNPMDTGTSEPICIVSQHCNMKRDLTELSLHTALLATQRCNTSSREPEGCNLEAHDQ